MTSSAAAKSTRVPRDKSGWWFAIPLRRGGYAVALVARNKPSTIMLVYALDRYFAEIPELSELGGVGPADCLPARMLTGHYIKDGLWPLIHRQPGFTREGWPIPVFFRVPPLGGPAYMTTFKEDDLAANDVEIRYVPGTDPRERDYPETLGGAWGLHNYFNHKFNPL